MEAISSCQCLDHLPAVAHWLRYADVAKVIVNARDYPTPQARTDDLVRENVIAQLSNIRTHPAVALALAQGKLSLHGWVYDIENGLVNTLDGRTSTFVPLSSQTDASAT